MNPYGIVSGHKARLFAIGFLQKYGIDNNEVFAHGERLETMRLVIEIASNKNCSLYQLDINFALLNGPLEEIIFVTLPPSF